MDYIVLEDIRLFARHGCTEEEFLSGGEFSVSVKIGLDLQKAGENDDLSGSVNYAEVFELIKTEMAVASKTLENAAWRIRERILQRYDFIQSLDVEVAKLNPPLHGKIKASKVILKFER